MNEAGDGYGRYCISIFVDVLFCGFIQSVIDIQFFPTLIYSIGTASSMGCLCRFPEESQLGQRGATQRTE